MFFHRSDSDWEVRAPAKVNFFFEVLARRDDGFHEIETLMIPVSVFDTLYFSTQPAGPIRLTCQGVAGLRAAASDGHVPTGMDNLVVRAVTRLRECAGTTASARMHLVKRIPSAAGLGGGSSDAAAALAVANRAWRLGWSRARLRDLATELGSDVPFFLGTGAAVCRGRGERVERVGGLGRLSLVVVRPPEGLSTARVFAACQPAADRRGVGPLVAALRAGALGRVGRLLHNRLQPAAASLSPWIGRLQDELAKASCLGHQMTGSGSAYFGLCHTARHARRLAVALRSRNIGRVLQVSTL